MEKTKLLSGNILKLLGCVFMLIDHLGAIIFPEIIALRIIGRLAYPIFAFTLSEGCFHTRNRLKHFLLIFVMAIIIQIVYYFAIDDYSLSIFMVFSISIILIYLYDYIHKLTSSILENEEKDTRSFLLWILMIILFLGITTGTIIFDALTPYLKASYGFQGVLIPVIVYITMKLSNRNLVITLVVMAIALSLSAIMRVEYHNFFSLISILLLLLYNNKRGKYNLKYFFYLFYPLHLVIIYLIYLIIK